MLRRNNENALEFLVVERALEQLAPGSLSLERKIVLRDRIFSQLGPQDATWRDRTPALVRTRWVTVPAGIGLAAAVLGVVADESWFVPKRETAEGPTPEFMVNGVIPEGVERGRLVSARTNAWITHGNSAFGLEAGSSMLFHKAEASYYEVELIEGDLSVAPGDALVRVTIGMSWADVEPGESALFSRTDGLFVVKAIEGQVRVSSGGQVFEVTPGSGPLFIDQGNGAGQESTGETTVSGPAAEPSAASGGGASPNAPILPAQAGKGVPETTPAGGGQDTPGEPGSGGDPNQGTPATPRDDHPSQREAGDGHAQGNSAPEQAGGNGNAEGNPPEDPGNGNGNAQGDPPEDPGNGSGNAQGDPPEDPGSGNGNAQGDPPEDPGSGNGNAQGNPPEDPGNGNGNAQGNPPEDPGNGSGNAQGNPPEDPGNGSGNAQGNPPEDPGSGNDSGNGNPRPDEASTPGQPGGHGSAAKKANPGKPGGGGNAGSAPQGGAAGPAGSGGTSPDG